MYYIYWCTSTIVVSPIGVFSNKYNSPRMSNMFGAPPQFLGDFSRCDRLKSSPVRKDVLHIYGDESKPPMPNLGIWGNKLLSIYQLFGIQQATRVSTHSHIISYIYHVVLVKCMTVGSISTSQGSNSCFFPKFPP